MTNKKAINTLLAGAVALATMGVASSAHAMSTDPGTEKCYGVVKAGMNACASADKAHNCAGMAKEDASGVEWIALPEGVCAKLAGGSLEPKMDAAAEDGAAEGTATEEAPAE